MRTDGLGAGIPQEGRVDMDSRDVYLRQNVVVEPLFNNWYAWSYLIPPATAAMFITNWHLRIMHSFVASPQFHVNALRNPEMLGGPYVDQPPSRAGEVKALLEATAREQSHMREFAEAIKTLEAKITNEANGFSIQPLYREVPEILKGYVELAYDLSNRPSIRFIEGLLYASPFYDERRQSVELSLITDDRRSFVFSTPRLATEGHVNLRLPFRHEGVDELAKMKSVPQPLARIKETLGVKQEDRDLFTSFFTEEGGKGHSKVEVEGVRIRYFGHACLLIESLNVSILCDPLLSYEYESEFFRYTYADLPETLDYVLITHNHQDHCMFETLLQLRHKIKNIIVPRSLGEGFMDPSLKLILKNIGFRNVYDIEDMESIEVEGGTITGLPFLGEHADLFIRTKSAYLVTLMGRSILCAADSNNIDPPMYKHVHDAVGDVDVVFLGMECVGAPLSWLYGPLLTKPLSRKMDQTRRFEGSNFQRGMMMIEQLNPKAVYVYAMGHEPWLSYLTSINFTSDSPQIVESNKLIEECTKRGIVSERLLYHRQIVLSDARKQPARESMFILTSSN
jgi:L-ascorbate metabolism protein UlaG (beta-lactamase superfamily)